MSVKSRSGHTEYKVVQQGSNTVYQDATGHRIGSITAQGKTLNAAGHILANNPRPDLILCQQHHKH